MENQKPPESANNDHKEPPVIGGIDHGNEEIKKENLCLQIMRYLQSQRFGQYLKNNGFRYTPDKLRKKKLEELEGILNKMRFSISCRNTSNFWKDATLTSVKIAEPFVSAYADFNIKGLSSVLQHNDEFLDLIEQIQLENQSLTYIDPRFKLIYTILQSALAVDASHKLIAKNKEIRETSMGSSIALSQTEPGSGLPFERSDNIQMQESRDLVDGDPDENLEEDGESE